MITSVLGAQTHSNMESALWTKKGKGKRPKTN